MGGKVRTLPGKLLLLRLTDVRSKYALTCSECPVRSQFEGFIPVFPSLQTTLSLHADKLPCLPVQSQTRTVSFPVRKVTVTVN